MLTYLLFIEEALCFYHSEQTAVISLEYFFNSSINEIQLESVNNGPHIKRVGHIALVVEVAALDELILVMAHKLELLGYNALTHYLPVCLVHPL